MIGKTILETTYSKPEAGCLPSKLVLHVERNGNVCYNEVTADGTGWNTKSFHHDLEKGIKYFLKQLTSQRKSWADWKEVRVILPRERAKDISTVLSRINDAPDSEIDALSTSERALLTLMRQGGSWASRVYQAIPDVIDALANRFTGG